VQSGWAREQCTGLLDGSGPSPVVLVFPSYAPAHPPCAPLLLLLLQALRVMLQQRVSALAVLAGSGPSPNMRLVGNLSASDLRHLRKGGFGGLALSVKSFLASKPLAPDQVQPSACRAALRFLLLGGGIVTSGASCGFGVCAIWLC
jgi:hypothetical protein